MTHPDLVIDALAALRDTGLVTDRRRLNIAFAQLTGRIPFDLRAKSIPNVEGPCAVCKTTITRYGERGAPLCATCQTKGRNAT